MGVLRPKDLLDGSAREALRDRAFRWVKQMGETNIEGHALKSLFRDGGICLWWWCETSLWEGRGDGMLFPGAVQVAWSLETIQRLVAEGETDSVVISGDSPCPLLHLAAEAARTAGIPTVLRIRHRAVPVLPRTLKVQLSQFALNRRRLQWRPRELEPEMTVFVTYATRVRIAGGGEDANFVAVSRELEARGKEWRAIVVDNAADATKPWKRSLETLPKGYEALESLISGAPASRAARTASRIARRFRSSWESIAAELRWENIVVGPAYVRVFRTLLSSHVPSGAYYFWAFREVFSRWQPARLVVVNETGYAGRAAVAAGNASGVPTIGLQHGVITPTHIEYVNERAALDPPNPDAVPIPTRTLLDGDYYREVLQRDSAYPPQSLVVCGAPRYDTFLSRLNSKPQVSKEYVTLLTQPIDELPTVRAILQMISRLDGVRLAIRPHPLEDPKRYQSALREQGINAPVMAREDLAEVFGRSIAVIAPFSTAVVEANLAGLPVAVVNLSGERDYVPYADRGGSVRVTALSELPAVVRDFLGHGPMWRHLSETRRTFLENFAWGAGAGSASRMTDAILALGPGPGDTSSDASRG